MLYDIASEGEKVQKKKQLFICISHGILGENREKQNRVVPPAAAVTDKYDETGVTYLSTG